MRDKTKDFTDVKANGPSNQRRQTMNRRRLFENPFQHSALAVTIYQVLDDADLGAGQTELGALACDLAELLAEVHNIDLGEAPDHLELYLDDPRGATGLCQAFAKSLARANKKRARHPDKSSKSNSRMRVSSEPGRCISGKRA